MSWEAIRENDPRDLEANLELGTIYQRLGDLTQSDLALARALEGNVRRRRDRAEALALQGRNAKARWLTEWRSAPPVARRQKALQSPFLKQAYERYSSAFNEDLNHYYSGLNALSLLVIMVELGAAYTDIWESMCDNDGDGPKQLETCRRQRDKLAAAVELTPEGGESTPRPGEPPGHMGGRSARPILPP